MRRFSVAEQQIIWDTREAGVPVKRIASASGQAARVLAQVPFRHRREAQDCKPVGT